MIACGLKTQKNGYVFYCYKQEFVTTKTSQLKCIKSGYIKVKITEYAVMLDDIDVMMAKNAELEGQIQEQESKIASLVEKLSVISLISGTKEE